MLVKIEEAQKIFDKYKYLLHQQPFQFVVSGSDGAEHLMYAGDYNTDGWAFNLNIKPSDLAVFREIKDQIQTTFCVVNIWKNTPRLDNKFAVPESVWEKFKMLYPL